MKTNGAGKRAGFLGLIPLWVVLYLNLKAAANFVVGSLLKMPFGSHLTETTRFFLFEVPKVLLLLTLIVFVVGIIRTYFSPERTRKILECCGHHPHRPGPARERRFPRYGLGLHDVRHRPLASRNDHPPQSLKAPLDPRFRRHRRDRYNDCRVRVQSGILKEGACLRRRSCFCVRLIVPGRKWPRRWLIMIWGIVLRRFPPGYPRRRPVWRHSKC